MKVLIVARCKQNRYAPFITEQINALDKQAVQYRFFGISKNGISGYISHLRRFRQAICEFRPDVIHAHYGLCGLFANCQRDIPVVTTYHGSDINNKAVRIISRLSMHLSFWNIFVSRKTLDIAKPKKHFTLLPCGVDLCDVQKTSKTEARRMMNLDGEKKYVLFSGAFDDVVKNAPLAKDAVSKLHNGAQLLELKGYSRKEVTLLMCAADALLMTSFSEGSPQVIKEALACGCPIVSVDVGDVAHRISGVKGCFVANTYDPKELTRLLENAISFEGRTNGLVKVVSDGLDNSHIAERLLDIYNNAIQK